MSNFDVYECAVLSLCVRADYAAQVFSEIKPGDFSADLREYAQAAFDLLQENRAVDVVTVAERMESNGAHNAMEFVSGVVEQSGRPVIDNLNDYCAILGNRGLRRNLYTAAFSAKSIIEEERDAATAQQKILADFEAIKGQQQDESLWDMSRASREFLNEMQRRNDAGGELIGLSTGWGQLDDRLNGMRPGDLIIVAGRPSMGKAQPLSSKILMASGQFKQMADIRVGDQVASVDGGESVVVGTYPQGVRDIYQVTLSDGRRVECDLEHLWSVESCKFAGKKILTTKNIMEMIGRERYQSRLRLTAHSGEFGVRVAADLDPWLVGFLIGDGNLCNGSVRFSTAEPWILEKVNSKLPETCSVKQISKYEYRIVGTANKNPALDSVRLMGLDKPSCDKVVPDQLMAADRETRLQVLLGLIESDGWSQNQSLQFSTSSKSLAFQMQDLARSLGGMSSIKEKTNIRYTANGESFPAMDAYICSICFDGMESAIKSERVLKNMSEKRKRSVQPTIRSIEFVRRDLAQCIKVSHPSSLYITDEYTVTHNTTFAMNIVEYNATRDKIPSLVFSMEMSAPQVIEKMTASLGEINLNSLRRGCLTEGEWKKFSAASQMIKSAKLHIDDRGGLTVAQMRARAHEVKRREGSLGLIMVDYLQLMSAGKAENRTQEITKITGGLKALGKEFQCPVIALSQLSRSVESRNDKRPMMSDLRESGSIEQDADVILFPFREGYYVNPDDPDSMTEIIFGKVRMGERGSEGLEFQGKFSRFKALDSRVDFAAIRAAKEAAEKQEWQDQQRKKKSGRGMTL